jgi:hypothetical protein
MTRRVLAVQVGLALIVLCPLFAGLAFPAAAQDAPKLPSAAELLDKMTRDFSPAIPHDVDPALKKQFENQKKFAEVQLQFDIVSWESFVALCWPIDKEGKPKPKIGDPGNPLFDTYQTSEDIFDKTNAKAAVATNKPRQNRRFIEDLKFTEIKPGDRVLDILSSVNGKLQLGDDEVAQAFAYPIWDQNGMMVRYEILLNKEECHYIIENGLQTIDGQVKFTMAGKKVQFPSGMYGKSSVGAIEVKLGWKVLGASDDESRFLVADAFIITGNPLKAAKVKVGLIGMHIAHKTETSPQWIWSTFSHVDALNADALTINPKTGQPRSPLFTNPNKETAVINTPSATKKPFLDGLTPTQVLQLTPIPLATQQVNHKAQGALRAEKSVLQYYELLNTQWPTNPAAPPTPGGQGTAPGSITNKPGGNPTPVYLVNPLFETYFQKGNQEATNQEELPPGGKDTTQVFGTESCMGCHSSAGVYIKGGSNPATSGQLTGDFSWLLSTKAK